jgi:hypothetical protein
MYECKKKKKKKIINKKKKKKKRLIKLIELRRTKGQCSLIIDQLNIFD